MFICLTLIEIRTSQSIGTKFCTLMRFWFSRANFNNILKKNPMSWKEPISKVSHTEINTIILSIYTIIKPGHKRVKN